MKLQMFIEDSVPNAAHHFSGILETRRELLWQLVLLMIRSNFKLLVMFGLSKLPIIIKLTTIYQNMRRDGNKIRGLPKLFPMYHPLEKGLGLQSVLKLKP